MTIRNLEKLFDARSVAIIGASESAGSIGSVISQNVPTLPPLSSAPVVSAAIAMNGL